MYINNPESDTGVKLRKSQLKFDNDSAVLKKIITVRITAITRKASLLIQVKVEAFSKIEKHFIVFLGCCIDVHNSTCQLKFPYI